MTLILQGTDNSVSSPAVQGGTAGTTTGVYYPATNQVALATNGTLALIVDSSQNVGVGTSIPNSYGKLCSVGTNTSSALLAVRDEGTSTGNLFIVSTNSVGTIARINSYGIGIGGATPSSGMGITFPATQSASSDANTLDDYEEGTWTPTVFVGATQQTVGTATGTYVKIGKTVFIAFRAENITKSGTGDLSVQGLPFLADVSGNQNKYSEFLVRYAGMNTGGWMQGLIAGASSLISFQNLNSTSGYTGSTTDANLSATYQIYGCTGFYTATA